MALTSIAELVPLYVDGPSQINKRQAVHCIVSRRLDLQNACGAGNRAKRRARHVKNNFGRKIET